MSELSDVVGGNTVTASFTNQVKERSLMRYATASARDTSIPAPIAGSQAWLEDTDKVTIYDGAQWFDARFSDAEVVAAIPHRIILTDTFESPPLVSNGTVLDTVVLPNESGSCRIVVTGPCGFAATTSEVAFGFTGTGLSSIQSQRVLAPAVQFTIAMGWTNATLTGQTISIVADADRTAYYRGSVVVTQL